MMGAPPHLTADESARGRGEGGPSDSGAGDFRDPRVDRVSEAYEAFGTLYQSDYSGIVLLVLTVSKRTVTIIVSVGNFSMVVRKRWAWVLQATCNRRY